MFKRKRLYLDFIKDINDEIQNIEEFAGSLSYEDFIRDKKTLRAVIKCFEIMGEAVKNIPTEIREKYPDMPWKDMAGMRDKLVHEYFISFWVCQLLLSLVTRHSSLSIP